MQGEGYQLYDHRNVVRRSAFRPPGTTFLIYAVLQLSGVEGAHIFYPSSGYVWCRVVWCLLGALSVPLLYACSRDFLAGRLALLPAALLAFLPSHAYYSMHL